jgi:hypothetical protein
MAGFPSNSQKGGLRLAAILYDSNSIVSEHLINVKGAKLLKTNSPALTPPKPTEKKLLDKVFLGRAGVKSCLTWAA